jgi:hypothetical protein
MNAKLVSLSFDIHRQPPQLQPRPGRQQAQEHGTNIRLGEAITEFRIHWERIRVERGAQLRDPVQTPEESCCVYRFLLNVARRGLSEGVVEGAGT